MLSSLVATLALIGTAPETPLHSSYLFHMELGPEHKIHLQGKRYHPQPGDLILFDDHCKWTRKLYHCCGTSTPLHAGIVFVQPDGSMAILEAGTNAVWKIFIFDFNKRLHEFNGTILIRTLKTPLNTEQSTRLTEFCHAQEGKPYALGRLIMQGTPFRPQGTLRGQLFGRTVLDRDRWICSELAVAACVVAGVFDASAFPANAMYPRDLAYDERHDLSPYFHPPALWYPQAQLEHLGSGVRILTAHEK